MSATAEPAPSTLTAEPLPPNPDPLLNVPITPELIARHNLLPEEYERVRQLLGRDPTLTELGVFSVMWSEHCSYKNSRKLLRGFPTAKADPAAPGQVLVKAGEENAGIIDIGDGWGICFKIESHNHPSAVEPFEGAATGVGGIIRDIFTMGARPVLLTNSLRFGELTSPAARRLFRGVVSGISHYGNCIGVPNVGGDIYFDPCYEGNPLVNALCLGTLKHDQIKRGVARGAGNPVYYVGAATGRDGLGGASFASRELSEASAADRPAVQKGDPFMEKLLLEACLEMMAVPGLVIGIQDMGAAGLTCSTCETASRGNSGIHIELDRVPQRETGMNSYEILLSESQERMLVIVTKGRESELEAIFKKWDLHAARIGEVTDGHNMLVTHHGIPVVRIPAKALADEAPLYDREAREPAEMAANRAWTPAAAGLKDLDPAGIRDSLFQLLSHPTIAEKRWVWRQYDHMVQAGTAILPGADAAIVRLRLGAGRERLLAIANDCNNIYVRLNPRRGGQIAVVECLRNLTCSGARPLGMTNNLNFGNPYKPESFYFLREAILGLAEACREFDVPVVGGNVSLYNESPTGPIDPTPTVSIAGIVDRPQDVTTPTLKTGEESFILLGGFPHELGGSYFLRLRHGLKAGDAPALDFEAEKKLQNFVRAQIRAGRVAAAHDLSEGGLLVALSEMLFAPHKTFGADLSLLAAGPAGGTDGIRLDALLFGESQGRILIAVKANASRVVLAAAATAGVPAHLLGEAQGEAILKVVVPANHRDAANFTLAWPVGKLREAWADAIPKAMAAR
jgi:phosphoribosylformylglycinamidine synthase